MGSRLGDRKSVFNFDCYEDATRGPYLVNYTLTAAGTLNITKVYDDSGW